MTWWKSEKCSTCRKKLKTPKQCPIIRLDTEDGVVELKICDECADFFDKSAEVLQNKPRNTTRDKPV